MSENEQSIAKYRQQLMFLTNQKQQLQYQINVLDSTLKELDKTKEDKVYKGTGNIFILSDKSNVLKETKELKETLDLKIKNIEKQEDFTIKKINSLSKSDKKEDKEDDNSSEGVV